jgi:ADP-ribose pyrophosphatase YjhB (NUDIX family)
MPNQDILIDIETGRFSFRVAGICLQNDRVLLQHPLGDPFYAFPGGHVRFGETSAETLAREFKEETGAEIIPGRLLWVEENFFQWGEKPCHQICLYFLVELSSIAKIPLEGCFLMPDEEERKISNLEFCWFAVTGLDAIEMQPPDATAKLLSLPGPWDHLHAVHRVP